jgi:hypothetical protein
MERALLTRDSENFFENYLIRSKILAERVANYRQSQAKRVSVVVDPPNLVNATKLSDANGFDVMTLEELEHGPENAGTAHLIFITNNVLSKILSLKGGAQEIRYKWAKSLFVCQDYDNHHWFDMSTLCMEFSDFYFPSHPSGIGWHANHVSETGHFIPCGSIQWSRSRLKLFFNSDIFRGRSDEPLGLHHFYPKFTFRNRTIKSFSEHFPKVNFVDSSKFHSLTEEEKMDSWKAHKVHVIIPVNADIPIRFFDALITGGMPVVPREIATSLELFKVPSHFYSTYAVNDLVKPNAVIDSALRLFDLHGEAGVYERANYALQHYHVSSIIESMLLYVYKKIDTLL